jgi:hypothetical protein
MYVTMATTTAEINKRRVPPEKRKRTETSCDICKSRKQKCDRLLGQAQCRYCEIHNLECATTQPRKKRVYGGVEGLGSRIALLESLVKGLVPEADLSSNEQMQELGKQLGIPLPVVEETCAPEQTSKIEEIADNNALPLVPDQQGQVQYIGPSSSFNFHLNLRRLISNYSAIEFAMFGRNAADQPDTATTPNGVEIGSPEERFQRITNVELSDHGSPSVAVRETEGPVLEALIDAYFETINPDFPVLHEASFREAFELWSSNPSSTADPAWLCGLLCLLILARRVAAISLPEEVERKWWRHVQTLLPSVFFASNIFSVQALLLAALHLHNTSHRDACWNLTGTAVRIGYAIGLHRDDIKHKQNLLGRELRKQLWWTLYAFEQMQVSSYDRPSAISSPLSTVSCPNERIVGVAGQCPQDFMKWSQKLVILLGSACKAMRPQTTGDSTAQDDYSKPLSPSASILRELNRWEEALPSHLRLGVLNSIPTSSQRSLLLLHAQFYYIRILISRPALLRQATILSKNSNSEVHHSLRNLSEVCIDSGRCLGRVLKKLEAIGKFSALVWWDIFYDVASALVLVLDIICRVKQNKSTSTLESKSMLRELSALTARQLQNPRIPGSMKKWASVIVEVSTMADQFIITHQGEPQQAESLYNGYRTMPALEEPLSTNQEGTFSAPSSTVQGALYGQNNAQPVDTQLMQENDPQFWAQLSLLENPSGELQDLRWDDIEAILRGDYSA